MVAEKHQSADGLLTLIVSRDDEDITIGFDGYTWHTHGALLAASYPFGDVAGLTPETAAARFVEDVVSNRAVIVVQRVLGEVRDVWVTQDVAGELRYANPEEILEFRYWDGREIRPSAG